MSSSYSHGHTRTLEHPRAAFASMYISIVAGGADHRGSTIKTEVCQCYIPVILQSEVNRIWWCVQAQWDYCISMTSTLTHHGKECLHVGNADTTLLSIRSVQHMLQYILQGSQQKCIHRCFAVGRRHPHQGNWELLRLFMWIPLPFHTRVVTNGHP